MSEIVCIDTEQEIFAITPSRLWNIQKKFKNIIANSMNKKSPLEDVESTLFTSWLRGNNLLNGHVPNETPTKRKIVTPE